MPAYSPVIVKRVKEASWNIEIDVLSLEALWGTVEGETWQRNGIEYKKPLHRIWVFRGFSKGAHRYWVAIEYLARHQYSGNLLRINTTGGLVDVSPNHSMLSYHGEVINARGIKVGDRIPMPNFRGVSSERGIFIGSKDLAWFYGFFLAEGSISRNKKGYLVSIGNNDTALLLKSKSIIEKELNLPVSTIYEGGDRQKRAYKIGTNSFRAWQFFKELFYDSQGKRVPSCILNAPLHIKDSFLKGFNDGDGVKAKLPPTSYDSTSQTLLSGISFLANPHSFSVHIRDDKPNVCQVTFNKGNRNRKGKGIVKKIREISYTGYLYDIETDDHTFCTGIGPVRVHNTDITGSNLYSALGLLHSPKWGLDTLHKRVVVPEVSGYWLLSIASFAGEEYAVLWEGSHNKELTEARDKIVMVKDLIEKLYGDESIENYDSQPDYQPLLKTLTEVERQIADVLSSSKWRFVSELLSEDIVTWPEPLDFLIADLPPSTSNEMFSFFDQVKDLFGVIIVSQPAKISTVGLLRTIDLLRGKQIPIIGLVANQDGFLNRYNEIEYQFLSPRVDLEEVARKAKIPFLVSIPQSGDSIKLQPYFSELADKVISAKPVVLKEVTVGRKLKRKVVKGVARRL